jgi:phage terminase large subunit-like protein
VEQGRDKFQGDTIDFIWVDEEPPEDIDEELRMRVIVKNGHIIYTMTPLQGVTKFYDNLMRNDDVPKIHLTWEDVPHLTEDAKKSLTAGMSEEMKLARTKGVATIGTGKIIQFDESDYTCPDFAVPRHWPEIGGLDIGLTHPLAAVRLRHDEESDIVYVTAEYRAAGKTPVEHSSHLRPWGCRFSLSKDAFNRNLQTGLTTAEIFTREGLDVFMCDMSKGSLDASIHEMRARIGSGRFFIFQSCQMLLGELRTWRANDKGIIVKLDDDLIAATRYALMKLDKAEVPSKRGNKQSFTISDGSANSGGYAGF